MLTNVLIHAEVVGMARSCVRGKESGKVETTKIGESCEKFPVPCQGVEC